MADYSIWSGKNAYSKPCEAPQVPTTSFNFKINTKILPHEILKILTASFMLKGNPSIYRFVFVGSCKISILALKLAFPLAESSLIDEPFHEEGPPE